jgi:hypothetical protein
VVVSKGQIAEQGANYDLIEAQRLAGETNDNKFNSERGVDVPSPTTKITHAGYNGSLVRKTPMRILLHLLRRRLCTRRQVRGSATRFGQSSKL